MPRFVLDCERMKYPNTGLYTYCKELGKAMTNHLAPSEELYFYLPAQRDASFEQHPHYDQKQWHKLWVPFKKNIHIWHTTHQFSGYFPGSDKFKRVLTIHDLNFLYANTNRFWRQRLLSGMQRLINKADHLVTISHYVKNDVLRHLNTGNKPISVIYNGCDVTEFPSFSSPIYHPERPFLFSIGTILPKKNFHVIPALLKGTDYELVLAGNVNTSYQRQILQEAAQQGVYNQVKILGPINDEHKYWYLKNCAAFVFPSIAEGFGIPVIEAMHYGKPVFLSNKTSLPEIGGSYAYYFNNFEPAHMRTVFTEGMAAYATTQPADAIRQHARSFCWSDIARQYLEIYRSLIA
ncbi:glycosyltransferase family 4 protein [Chitinophaga sp. 30R24]|uniref:glycosyltransferase family 4 protein n=1 Tax=Chitinophaga sp. 30R24 TaxID=3248838 RepID=UPI003B91E822